MARALTPRRCCHRPMQVDKQGVESLASANSPRGFRSSYAAHLSTANGMILSHSRLGSPYARRYTLATTPLTRSAAHPLAGSGAHPLALAGLFRGRSRRRACKVRLKFLSSSCSLLMESHSLALTMVEPQLTYRIPCQELARSRKRRGM